MHQQHRRYGHRPAPSNLFNFRPNVICYQCN
jgi:hypothetical protein